MDEQNVIKFLNWFYYGIMLLSLAALSIMYYAFTNAWFEPIDPMSTWGKTVQYIIILDALVSIPGGLYGFKRLCEPLRNIENQGPKLGRYRALAAWRIVLVSNTMPLGIVAFYWLGGYRSMLWIAAIAAIGWFFTKPTLGKLYEELEPREPGKEDY